MRRTMSLNLFPDEADKWRQDQMTILCTVISQDTVQGKGDMLTDDTASAHLGSFYGSTQAFSCVLRMGKLYGRCLLLVIRACPSFTMLFDDQVLRSLSSSTSTLEQSK